MNWWQWLLIVVGIGVLGVLMMTAGDIARYMRISKM